MNRVKSLLIGKLLCCWLALTAQGDFFKKYTMYDGLVQQQVRCIFQDSRGYMWIGTKGGLSKFNGESFEAFGTEDGLVHPFITDIEEDREGNIWIATWYGLSRYNGQDMQPYQTGVGNYNTIEIDDQDQIWFLSNHHLNGQRVMYLSVFENGKLIPAEEKYRAFEGLEINNMLYDKLNKRMLFAFHKDGLCSLENGEFKVIVNNGRGAYYILQKNSFSNGKIIVSEKTEEVGMIYYFLEKNTLSELPLKIKGASVASLDKAGHLYTLANQYNDFYIGKNESARLIYEEFNVIPYFYFDHQNNLWLGTEEGLVSIYNEAFLKPPLGLNENIWSIVEDADQSLWFASLTEGLQKMDNNRVRTIDGYKGLSKAASRFYMGAIKLTNGHLIFPLEKYVIEYDGNKFNIIETQEGEQVMACQFVLEDTVRDFLVLVSERGFYIRNKNGYLEYYSETDGMHRSDHALCVSMDRHNYYWVGTEHGVARFNYEKKEFKNYTKEIGNLDASEIKTIKKDHRGNMWFGGREGIYFYDEKIDSIKRVGAETIARTVNFLIEYENELLVVGAIDGLYLLHLNEYYHSGETKIEVFNHHNGYFGIDPIANGAFLDSKGLIWIPTREGVIKFDPKKRPLNSPPLNILIASVNGDKIPFNQDGYIYEVADGVNELKIKFEAIGHSRPFKTQYSYLLENVNEGWSEWQEEPYIIFNNLKTGRYIFKVKAKNIGIWEGDEKVATIVCAISLPFWKEPNFYMYAIATITILLGAGIYLYFRQRIQYARALKNEQEVKYLRVQTLQAQMNPHFVFNVLGTLQNLILNSDTKKANEHLVNLSKLIRRFLDSSVKSDLPKNIATENEITLEKEIELIQMYVEFEQLQYENEFNYELKIDKGLNISSHTIPPMIIQPYVENAIKHGLLPKDGKGKLFVHIFEENETLLCIIEDDGVGRSRAREIQQKSLRSYRSHGTELVKKRIDILNEMGYKIDITTADREGGGTRVCIKIGY